MEQAMKDKKENEKPAVFHRKDRSSWLVTMTFEDWIEQYKDAHKA